MRILSENNFKYGQIDSIEAQSIPRGAASSALNWLTKGDHIELRRGSKYLGDSTVNTGVGKATGLKKVVDAAGVDQLFGSYGQKVKHYNRTTLEWEEVSSNVLGSAVVDSNGVGIEPIFFAEYVSPAGHQLWFNSPNSTGYFKVMVANPTDVEDMYDSTKNFKGLIKIDTNRTLLWGYKSNPTGIYGSYIDTQTYTTVSAEVLGTGDGVTVTFADTAAAVSTAGRTIFAIVIKVNGTQVATDDRNGNITGTGITGTINYTTGALSVTWAAAPAGGAALTWDYQWENTNTNGISDFTKSATRLAGQGFIFAQDEGGGRAQNVAMYNQVYYCLHMKKSWVLNIGQTDTSATNLPYRQKVGIPNYRAAVETGEGIYYIDDIDKNDIKFRLLTYDVYGSDQVVPVPISNNIDLNDYLFDQAAAYEYGDYLLFSCATQDSTRTVNSVTIALNNRTIVYHKIWKSFDVLDYPASCFETYDGVLVAGDDFSNNFFELFSGFDDPDGVTIDNEWVGNLDHIDLEGLKKVKKLYLEGLIATDQSLEVYLSLDNGPFTIVATISGTGTYVDRGNPVTIGAETLGRGEIGGGSDGTNAYRYERLISLALGKFETAQIKFVATNVGYVSVSTQKWWDVRPKGQKVPLNNRG